MGWLLAKALLVRRTFGFGLEWEGEEDEVYKLRA
jgi:hypothetical protein